jgi:hypothetical protein
MSKIHHEALAAAARDALKAPSVFNTQPWRWRIDGDALELRADHDRQLTVADPQGRLLLLSCGASLHHARVALAAAGWSTQVRRFVEAFTDRILARVYLLAAREVTAEDRELHKAIARRRTDRRPFGDDPVPEEALRSVTAAAEAEGVRVHRVHPGEVATLAIAAADAGANEMANPDYVNELMRWTNRPEWSSDGVPASTAVRRGPRRVPVRDLAVEPVTGMPVEPGGDRGSAYLVLYGEGQEAQDWLRAGEALSAVLLTAVSLGLSVAPISDVIEVHHTRERLSRLLDGSGQAYVVVRIGTGRSATEIAEAPRRKADDVIDGLPLW